MISKRARKKCAERRTELVAFTDGYSRQNAVLRIGEPIPSALLPVEDQWGIQ
jgi:hypothetical protein